MARDDFPREVKDRLAKRVGLRCSRPDCRLPTAGPDATEGITNTGVAAHIGAASPGGTRYDETMTPEQRASINNGIWLCQTDAKMVDDDEVAYPAPLLHQWKSDAEHMAALEARGYEIRSARRFEDMEKKVPAFLAKMREDLRKHPLYRQFVILPSRRVSFGGGRTPAFIYFHEDNPMIMAEVSILQNYAAISDVTKGNAARYHFSEDFVDYLLRS